MKTKHLKSLLDLDKNIIEKLFDLAFSFKQRKGAKNDFLANRAVGLIFEKASTRTRVSFESAIIALGGTPVFLSSKDTQISRSEPICDTARVLDKYLSALILRTHSQKIIEEFAQYSKIPIINALSDLYHPCQILSDLMTVIEYKKDYKNLKIVWLGDGNNVLNSWINASYILDFKLHVSCPKGYEPIKLNDGAKSKNICFSYNPVEAVKNADIIYTDVWVSMGQEKETEEKLKSFNDYQLNKKLLSHAKEDCLIMHCLPAHRGEEITDEVIESKNSIVWTQAENKLYMHQAILRNII